MKIEQGLNSTSTIFNRDRVKETGIGLRNHLAKMKTDQQQKTPQNLITNEIEHQRFILNMNIIMQVIQSGFFPLKRVKDIKHKCYLY